MYAKRILICTFLLFFFLPPSAQAEVISDLPVPRGYKRVAFTRDSFSGWLQNLPVKEDKSILTHTGKRVAPGKYERLAVVDMPLLFSEDLEQCADFCMRFRAEYYRQTGRLEELYLFNYAGERQYFSDSGLNFRSFLRKAFAYSNSHSLKAGCEVIPTVDANGNVKQPKLVPGDMFIQNDTGGIGHVSMVTDLCVNDRGDNLYLIGFSFMPAQEFHIEKAPAAGGYGKLGWFSYEGYIRYLETYYPFGSPVLRRFAIIK